LLINYGTVMLGWRRWT